VKIKNLKWIIALGLLALTASACGNSNATLTPPTTRVATQTPLIIYVPVTTTPQPTLLPLLPTAEVKAPATRAPTRAVVKPSAVPTKPVVVVTPVAKPTAAPVCSIGTVNLKEPEPNASRNTKEVGVGGDTFRFIWDPPSELQAPGDPNVGYLLSVSSKRGGFSNGAAIYLSNNKYWNDGKIYIMDKPAVSSLAGGEPVQVTWNVTIIKVTSGSFSDSDPTIRPASFVTCGPQSETRLISLGVY